MKHLNHSHVDYTSPFFLKKKKTYGLYHNINIKLIIDDRKFVFLMVRNELLFLLLMTIFLIFFNFFYYFIFYRVVFPGSYEGFIYNIHSSTNYTKQ